MFAPVWEVVVAGRYRSLPAVLGGYRRLAVRGEDYPVAVPARDACIRGVLYLNLSPEDLARLDRFEGEAYRRRAVQVIAGGRRLPAEVYELRPEFRHLAAPTPWDPERFVAEGLRRFLARHGEVVRPAPRLGSSRG